MIRNCFRTSTISISEVARRASCRADRSLPRVCVVARARSKPPTIPLSRARTLTRAINHQRKQEQHAVGSSLLAAMAASDESPGGDGTMQGDELRAPLGLCARDPTPSAAGTDRSGPGANDPSTWHDRAIGGGGLRARTEPGETDPSTWRDRATGDDWSRGSTKKSYGFLWALARCEVAIWCLDIMLDALQHIERRTRRERMVQSPV